MVFSSLVFVYVFLAANLLCCALARTLRVQNVLLLLFSLFFYAWGEPAYVLLLIAVSFVDWLCALHIRSRRSNRGRRSLLILASVLTLGTLG
ncbi:MAG: MBOAT family protein, partial [Clostridia bacterium]|nr:MBOAT family protein [Clostridia bacterium]